MNALKSIIGAVPLYGAFLRSQYWSAEKWRSRTQEHLEIILRAALRIPFYRKQFKDGVDVSDFSSLPILTRSDTFELNQSVRSLYPADTEFTVGSSSGSTGVTASFLFDDTHQRSRFAARARYLLHNGWNPLRKTACIIAPRENAVDSKLMKSRLFSRLTLISVFTAPQEQVELLTRLDPYCIYTYPSNLRSLLNVIESRRVTFPSLKLILTGAEVLEDSTRKKTATVLGVPIADNYGSTEAFVAWQCREGTYHINAEHVLVEIVDESGAPSKAGAMGKVLLTTLENKLMPLLRYEIGDYAVASEKHCACGRTLPAIEQVVGRSFNLFKLSDGRHVPPWELIDAIEIRPWVKQFQILQKKHDLFVFRYVSDVPLASEQEKEIRKICRDSLGQSVSVLTEQSNHLPRTSGGKFMIAISELV